MKEEKRSWFNRLKEGLSKSSSKLTTGITQIFTTRKLDDEALEELEELLIQADLGVTTATKLTANLAKNRFDKEVTDQEVRQALATDIAMILTPVAKPLAINANHKPHVVLVVGVNGSGKTTTIGKLAKQYRDQGLKVMLAAGDTFRAAAVEQLQIWGNRTNCPVITGEANGDPAAVAYTALEQAKAQNMDVLLLDTAGRLHNKTHLMEELTKIRRVLGKLEDSAPHDCVLVLDATIGQNALTQVETFKEATQVTGLVVTKLDGTAKGGVLVALAEKFKLPVHAIGVGESAEDLQPFHPQDFANSLMGI